MMTEIIGVTISIVDGVWFIHNRIIAVATGLNFSHFLSRRIMNETSFSVHHTTNYTESDLTHQPPDEMPVAIYTLTVLFILLNSETSLTLVVRSGANTTEAI